MKKQGDRSTDPKQVAKQQRKEFAKKILDNKRDLYADFLRIQRKHNKS